MVSVQIERDISGEPTDVYEWFTDPMLLTRWWPSEAELNVEPGGTFRMYWDGPDVTLRGDYLVVEPGRRLEHTWSWDHDELPPRRVTITFTSGAGGTVVHVDHEHDSESEASDYRDGWEFFLGRLHDQLAST